MPEVFRLYGFIFYFYSREHEPIHIHIRGNGGYAIFDLNDDGTSFTMRECEGIKQRDLKKIIEAIAERRSLIISKWNTHFNNGE